LNKTDTTSLFKHFSPEAFTEANNSTWDDKTKIMITPTEKEALAEEDEISNIPWMIDLSALDTTVDETQSVTFQDGAEFDFNDTLSLNTTRVNGTTALSNPTSPTRAPVSILKSSPDSMTVNSEVTTETRIEDLETSVEKLTNDTSEILSLIRAQARAASVAPASGSGEKV
jgi:hypothetical protein